MPIISPRAREIQGEINKWDYSKSFCTAKENIIKMKTEPTLWENIFANDSSDKGLISKICKELHMAQHKKDRQPSIMSLISGT